MMKIFEFHVDGNEFLYNIPVELSNITFANMDIEKKLKEIESLAGINFEELRSKYVKVAAEQPKGGDIPNEYGVFTSIPHTVVGKTLPASSSATASVGQQTVVNLGKSKICKACQGQGVTSYVYNHMVLSQNCEQCDGEGVYMPEEAEVAGAASVE